MTISRRIATNAVRAINGAGYRRRTQGPPPVVRVGVITAVVTGPPKTVNLTLGGSAVELTDIRYVNSYTPTVSDVVEVRVKGSDLLVLGEYA